MGPRLMSGSTLSLPLPSPLIAIAIAIAIASAVAIATDTKIPELAGHTGIEVLSQHETIAPATMMAASGTVGGGVVPHGLRVGGANAVLLIFARATAAGERGTYSSREVGWAVDAGGVTR